MKFTPSQSNLILGCLLGDGNLQPSTDRSTWRFKVIHKAAHEAYVNHKYQLLREFCDTPPCYSNIVDPRTKKISGRYTFNTLSKAEFLYYGNLFYKLKDGVIKKVVPQNIESLLTPEALAYWYMDDGAMKWKGKSNAVRLCTDSFSTDEINRLKKALERKFSLKVTLQTKGTIQRLAIAEASYPTLKKLIAPYLVPCMYYKFPDGDYGVYGGSQDILNDICNSMDVPKDESSPDFLEITYTEENKNF